MICVSSPSYSKMYMHVKNSEEHKWAVKDALALSHKHRFTESGVLGIQPGRRPGGPKRPPPEPEEQRACAGNLPRERKKKAKVAEKPPQPDIGLEDATDLLLNLKNPK
jgi:hypothetical protein